MNNSGAGIIALLGIKSTEAVNVLAKKLPELPDLPMNHKLQIYTTGSVLGEEGACRQLNYQANLKCTSETGSLLVIPKEALQQVIRTS